MTGVFGACAIVWGIAVYVNNKENKTVVIESQLETIISTQVIQKNQNDSIFSRLGVLNMKVDRVYKGQNALQKNYLLHLSNDKTVTKEDLLNFMESLQGKLKKNTMPIVWRE